MKHCIPTFRAEKEDGLIEKIQSHASIAYLSRLESMSTDTELGRSTLKAMANEEHPVETLFPLKDILVSTGWNLNADVFEGPEAWAARYTPEHHPFNFEHDDKRIIGHITSSIAVDEKFFPLPDDLSVEDLPSKFHIINGSVIYRVWSDPEQEKLIDQTIAEIKAGEWYVSMECVFRGFDYAVISPDGSARVVARNEESAFLTKHLRQYGGTGVYKDSMTGAEFKLGRVLRNITFSGKGLVRRPANPESVIFNDINTNVKNFSSLGYITSIAEVISKNNTESNEMPDTNPDIKRLEDKVGELVNLLDTANKRNDALATQLKERDGATVKAEIDGLKATITGREQKIETLETAQSEMVKAVDELKSQLKAVQDGKTVVETELATLKANNVERDRLALLTGKGATPEKATELVQKFANFTDDQFSAMVELVSAAWRHTHNNQTVTPSHSPKKPEEVIGGITTPRDAAFAAESQKVEERVAKVSKLVGGFLRYNKNTPAVTQ